MASLKELLDTSKSLYDAKKYEEVISLLTEDDLLTLNELPLRSRKAWSLYYLNRVDLMESEAEKILEMEPSQAGALFLIGYANLYRKNSEKAIPFFEKAAERAPRYVAPLKYLGIIYQQLKQLEKSNEYYMRAIAIKSSPDLFNSLGANFLSLKNYEKSIEYFEKALELDPKYFYSYNGLGQIYIELKQFKQAIKNFEKSLKIEETLYADNSIARIYTIVEEYDTAIIYYNKALTIDPKSQRALNNIGIVYILKEQYQKALEIYNSGIEINPSNPYFYYNRANTLYSLEQYENSLKDCKKYLELTKGKSDYYTSQAKSRIAELKKILNSKEYGIINELVNKIKRLLLFNDECLTHYTSMSVAKALILEGSSLRLSEGAFLNDTSEGRELFKFLSFHVPSQKKDNTIAKPFSKKPFIGSFVAEAKHNDLTLWRMYGKEAKEEAKGCAITLVKDKLIENLRSKLIPKAGDSSTSGSKINEDFTFYRVAYITPNPQKSFIIPGSAKDEADLNGLMAELSKKINAHKKKKTKIADQQNIIELLNEIAYLFKSAEYQYEHEIRLVVKGIGIEKHILKEIVPPKVYVELVDVSPSIKMITLGPKVERADEWASAFYYTLDKQELYPNILISHLPFK